MRNIVLIGAQNFWKCQKMKNFIIFLKKYFFPKIRQIEKNTCLKKHSTSPPCGNLVDGLPHDCHTETVATPARLAPAQNGGRPLKFGRGNKVLVDEMTKSAQKTLYSVC